MRKAAEPLTEEQFASWLSGITEAYPQIGMVTLVGSRAFGYAQPDSDWDVIIYLDDDEYKDEARGWELERALSFDRRFLNEAIDLFILRPDGGVARWSWGDAADLERELADLERDEDPEFREYFKIHLTTGALAGDFSRLYSSLSKGKVVFEREVSTNTAE